MNLEGSQECQKLLFISAQVGLKERKLISHAIIELELEK